MAFILLVSALFAVDGGPTNTTKTTDADADILRMLDSENVKERDSAYQSLLKLGDRLRPFCLKSVADGNLAARVRLKTIHALETCWHPEAEPTIVGRLGDAAAEIRIAACDLLAKKGTRGSRQIHDALVHGLTDRDTNVRRAVVNALAKIQAEGAGEAVVNLLKFDDGKDEKLRALLVSAIDEIGMPAINALMAMSDSGDANDLATVSAVFPSLRSAEAARRLPVLARNYHLSSTEITDLIRSFPKYPRHEDLSYAPIISVLDEMVDDRPKIPLDGTTRDLLDVASAKKGDGAILAIERLLLGEDVVGRCRALQLLAKNGLSANGEVWVKLLKDKKNLDSPWTALRGLATSKTPTSWKLIRDSLANLPHASLKGEALRRMTEIDEKKTSSFANDAVSVVTLDVSPSRQAEILRVSCRSERFALIAARWANSLANEPRRAVEAALSEHARSSAEAASLLKSLRTK